MYVHNGDIHIAVKCPAPLKNRDFVNQRSWRVRPREEYIVFNHSVSHKVMYMYMYINVKSDFQSIIHTCTVTSAVPRVCMFVVGTGR